MSVKSLIQDGPEKWADLNIRDKIQETAACMLLASGVIMSFLSFFLNNFSIEQSVLIYIAQALLFGSSMLGMSIYFRTKFLEFNNKADKVMSGLNQMSEQIEEIETRSLGGR